ncbi:MAG: DMT family transporter [Sedimenticolaceae bacterium]
MLEHEHRVSPISTYLYLVMAALFWGGTFVAGRKLAPLLDPHAAAFLRFCLASVLLLGWLYWRLGCIPKISSRQWLAVILLGASGIFAYNLLFFSGLQTVEAGRASLIIAANPVLIALVSHWLFREHLGWFRGLGIALSVAGAMIVIGRGDIFGLLAGQVGTGELLLLGCVVSWVAYTLIGRRVLRGLSPLVAVSYASVVGTVLLGLVTLSQGGIGLAAMQDLQVWLNIAYLAVFGTVLAFVWFYKGVQALGASRAAQFINLVPVSGVCLGAWLLDEPVTWSLLSGGLLVLLGLWLTNRPSGGSAAQVPERV